LPSYMRQLVDTTSDQGNNWRGDNHRAFEDQVDCSDPFKTSSGASVRHCMHFGLYSSNKLRINIQQPGCRHDKPGEVLVVRPLNLDEKIDNQDDNEKSRNSGEPIGETSSLRDVQENDDCQGEEAKQGVENGTGMRKGTNKREGNGKGKQNRNSKAKGSVKHNPRCVDISHAVAFQR
jgi:hypothetical protein